MRHLLLWVLLSVFSFQSYGADKYTLEYKLEKGKTYKQHVVSDGIIAMSVMGQDMEMRMKSEIKLNYEITGQQNDLFDSRMSFQKMKMDMAGGPVAFTIDSDSPEKSFDKNIGEAVKAIIGIPVEIQFTKQGKYKSVKGVDKLLAAFSEKLDAVDNPMLKQQMGATLSGQFSDEAIKSMCEQYAYFPGKPVALGDSWDVNMNLTSGGVNFQTTMKLTLKQVADNVATLDCTGLIATPEGGEVQKIQGMEAKINVNGIMSGIVRIDMKSGWTIASDLSQKFTMEFDMMGQKMTQQAEMKISMTAD
ncbi:MAG: DUF6263 family protein [Dysgonamonadaceae bacterium]|jgi:hypothetical protein|nr:DUF6263 family protein [Dysgonamonadaceae bacterium]